MTCPFRRGLDAVVADARDQLAEQLREAAGRLGDRHAVVVEDDDDLPCGADAVVEGLETGAVHDRRVADHRHRVLVRSLAVARRGESLGDRKRHAGMAGNRGIARRFLRIGKARDPAQRPQRAQRGIASGKDLPGIRLMSHIPDNAVARGIEHLPERHRDLDRAEGRGEMPAVRRDGFENPISDLDRGHLSSPFLRRRTRSVVAFCPKASSFITRS